MAESERYWSQQDLQQRGWSSEWIEKFLPEPILVKNKKRKGKRWTRKDVILAENGPEFPIRVTRIRRTGKGASVQRERTYAYFSKSWDDAQKDDSPEWLLAGHYHDAILSRLSINKKKTGMSDALVPERLNAFLNLEENFKADELSEVIEDLPRTAYWLGGHMEDELAEMVFSRYPGVLHEIARQVLDDFTKKQPQADVMGFLSMENFPSIKLVKSGMSFVWATCYVPDAIRSSLSLLVALNPMNEYPEARAMHRHFILHIGATNTGKTYAGFQSLIQAPSGIYLAPLRLLALEAQELMLNSAVKCSISTGEEEDIHEGDTHMAATAEKLNLKRRWDVAVIDECQMIADPQRGFAWTRAILGVLAYEIHLCAAPEAEDLLVKIIESCEDSCEIVRHERTTPLICMSKQISYEEIEPGDALITFSKTGVLSAAEDLQKKGKHPAVIYGALPYATRRKQMEAFLKKETEYIVATDAIGMGLNLPIRRVIFMETRKFDGKQYRDLKPEEVRQISGRAGRLGMYDEGYVGAMQGLELVKNGLEAEVEPLEYAVVGFSDLVLEVEFDLLEVLTEWNRMPTVEPYRKMDIEHYINVISKIRNKGFNLSREQELQAANIPFDETEGDLMELLFQYLEMWQKGEAIEQPEHPRKIKEVNRLAKGKSVTRTETGEAKIPVTLQEYELYCKQMDLYYSFSKAFGCQVDLEILRESREIAAAEINEILIHELRNSIRYCKSCGKPLPMHKMGKLCGPCHRKRIQLKKLKEKELQASQA